jgi:hypothetical protein
MNKFSLFVGPCATGKTILVVDALHSIKDKLYDFNIICAPTSNFSYRSMDLDDKLYGTFSVEEMNKLYERIEKRAAIANLCNTQSILNDLCDRLSMEPNQVRTAKDIVIENVDKLLNLELSNVERTVVKNIKMNPKVCVVFDDSAELFMELYEKSSLKKLVKNISRLNITLLVTAQDSKIFSGELMRYVNLFVFTHTNTAKNFISYFGNCMTEEDRLGANLMLDKFINSNSEYPNYNKFVLEPIWENPSKWYSTSVEAKIHNPFKL